MYYPKSLPYNMRTADAITWYSKELMLINKALKESETKEQHHRLLEYKARCMEIKEILKWKLKNDVKVVNVCATRSKTTYGRW